MNVYAIDVWLGQCVVDDSSRLLDHMISISGVTPQLCLETCSSKGFIFAGVQFGIQCFCGNIGPPSSRFAPEKECSTPCAGNKNQMCGATWRMNVYTQWSGQCVVDDGSRLLDHYISISGLTPQLCRDQCSAKGFIFAGLQYGGQCFCGNTPPPKSRLAPIKQCSYACSGDKGLKCGGYWRMNVYQSDVVVLKKNNLLKTLPTIGKQFTVSFDVYINKFGTGWQSILHLTSTGNNCCNWGDRVPAVWISHEKKFHILAALNGQGNAGYHGTVAKTGEWISVKISQTLINSKFVYEIKINGQSVYKVENKRAQEFKNVKVFAADNFYNALDGSIRGLSIRNQDTKGLKLNNKRNRKTKKTKKKGREKGPIRMAQG